MKKNILFIIGNMKSGGAEKVIYNLCNNLKDKYNITLALRTIKDADYIPDVNIVELKDFGYFKKTFKSIKQLKKIKKELNIDISISFLMKYCVLNYLSKVNDKIFFSTRNYMGLDKEMLPKEFKNKVYLKLYSKCIKKVDLVINVSKSVEEDQIRRYKLDKNKSIVINNYVDIENINKLKEEKISKEEAKLFKDKVILSVGRYNDQKGQWHLIRAFSKVVEVYPNTKLVLIGRGYLKDYYNELVSELNLNNNVFILDFKDNIYKYMNNSYMFVLTSFYEGMPNVLLESLSCSLPIIATSSLGGTKEIIAPLKKTNPNNMSCEEYGILIPQLDYKKYKLNEELTYEENILKDAIIKLLQDNNLYQNYKNKSIKRAKYYNKEKILNKWERIINDN